MTPSNDRKTEAAQEADGSLLLDRRRPGRQDVDPNLIPLLRGQVPATDLVDLDEPDQLSAARGISVGVLLSAPLWIGIVALGRWMLS